MQREKLNREEVFVVEVSDIFNLWGDLGFKAEGLINGRKFTAGLGQSGQDKTGWHCGRLKGQSYGKEYTQLYNAVKTHMDQYYFPLQQNQITEDWASKDGSWAKVKKVKRDRLNPVKSYMK